MGQNLERIPNITHKRKRTMSIPKSRSPLSMNSNTSDFSIVRQISFKKRKSVVETTSYRNNNDESSPAICGNLTSLEVHDSSGNIVGDNESQSDKTDVSQIHIISDSNFNASSNFAINLSENSFIPSAKPPKTPSVKSLVLNDWESYSSLSSGTPSNKNSYVTVNSIPNSISSFVRKIPKTLRSEISTSSSAILSNNSCRSISNEPFVVHDVVHAYRNKLKVKLSEVVPHSNKRWLNIFKAKTSRTQHENFTSESSLSNHLIKKETFKKPAKTNLRIASQNDQALGSLIKSDPNIVPQKIFIPNFSSCDLYEEHIPRSIEDLHCLHDVTDHTTVAGPIEIINKTTPIIHQKQIFSPNTNLKNSSNGPNYPEYIPGFSSLCIRDSLLNLNTRS